MKKLTFSIMGRGAPIFFITYNETSDETNYFTIGDDLSESVVDCIYNVESNLILASLHSNCDDYNFDF